MLKKKSLAELLGITEVDIRDVGYFLNFDIFRVRTWNHRTFDITGQMVYMYSTGLSNYKNRGLVRKSGHWKNGELFS